MTTAAVPLKAKAPPPERADVALSVLASAVGVTVTTDDVAATRAELYRHLRMHLQWRGVRAPETDAELHEWLTRALEG